MLQDFLRKFKLPLQKRPIGGSIRRRQAQRRLTVEQLESRNLPAPLAWSTGTSLPDALGGLAAVQSNQYTVILGGAWNLIKVPAFVAANPSWKTVIVYTTPLDQPRVSPGAAVLADGTLLMFGGQDSVGETLSSSYNFYGTPSSPASMTTARYQFGYATDENHIVYAIGGLDSDGIPISAVESYHQSTNTWTTLSALPQGLSSLSAVADGTGHVFAFGGIDGSGHISSAVYRYTFATNVWDTVAPLPVATDNSAAVLASNGLIYVLGGVTSSGTTSNVESYNESTNTWTIQTPLPVPVSGEAATSDSLGRIVVAGGFDANNYPTAWTFFSQLLNQADTAPVITSAAPGAATANLAFTFQVLSTGNPQPTYTLTTAPAGMTINSNTGLISWTASQSQVGYQTVTVQASNYAGQTSQTYTLGVIGPAPTGLTATGSSTSSIALSWNASTDPGGVSGYNVYEKLWHRVDKYHGYYVYNRIATGVTATSYTVTGLGTGSYHTYVVTDVGAVTGLETPYSVPSAAQTWYPPSFPQAPAFLLSNGALWSGPVNVTENQTVQITLLGVGNPLNYTVLSGPTTVSIANTGVVTYTPAASEIGQVNITFEAYNPVGTATQTVTFNVLPAPTIIFHDGPFTFNGYAFYATATAVGSDGVTPVSGTFTFTYSGPSNPPSFAGSYLVTAYFTSSDPNYGSTTATSTMIINPAQAVFTGLSSPTIPVGKTSVTLSGKLTAGALYPASGTINVTLNGVTHAANLGTGGAFSTTFNTSSLAAGAYSVTYAYVPGDTNYTAQNASSTLYVGAKPHVTVNPKSQTVIADHTVTFTAAATGTPTPTVQWQVSTDGGKTFSNISGATSTTLTFVASAGENGYRYRAVFTNSLAVANSSAATLTVQYAPTVTLNPSNQTVAPGHSVTFKAAAIGNPMPTVQWQVSTDGGTTWINITGATSTTLTFTANIGENGNKYRAVFTNIVGTATATAATLTV